MIVRLVAICAVELLLVVLLTFQVFGGDAGPSAVPSDALSREAATDLSASLEIPESETDSGPEPVERRAPAPERATVEAQWDPEDPVGVLLTGVVRDGAGVGVAGTYVAAARDDRRLGVRGQEDGSYAVTGLAPGDWTIRISAEGAANLEESLTLTGAAVQEHDFVVDRSFAVRVWIVTPDGADATRALQLVGNGSRTFVVAGQKDRFPERLAPTDDSVVFAGDAQWNGEANPRDGFAGTLLLQSPPPAHVALLQRHLVLEQQMLGRGQSEVRFTIDVEALEQMAASAVVTVVDEAGRPVEGARVSLNTSNEWGGSVATAADGRAVVEGLAPGLLRCEIAAEGRERMYTTVRLEPGERLDLGEVHLGPALPLEGRVVDADGSPVGGAAVSWTELKWLSAVRPLASNRSARSDAEGVFRLPATGRGTIAVAARTRDGRVAHGVFENPSAAPVELRLAQPAECVVTCPSDATRSFVVVWFDAQRRPIAANVLDSRRREVRVALAPGEYGYEVRDQDGRVLRSGTLQLGASDARLDLR